ncbi:MAG: hypothetical protein HY959_02345 [Ignavibacteriae bacterium]|nr:hypothetical protein [Ignavibacteriota bacterium]
MKKLFLFAVLIIFLFAGKTTFAQLDSAEINWSVPELFKFHDVIYLIWHEAYPAKDVNALKGFVPEIKSSMEKINNAKLPGIVREKEEKWKEGLIKFNETAANYYKAAEGTDAQAILDAAENLHSNFEMMVRILKPVAKEIDEYHKVLYVIYHKYFPDKKYNDILGVMDDLIAKADAVTKVAEDKLQKRLKEKFTGYAPAAKELYDNTVALKDILKTNDSTKIDASVEKMHSSYQKLEELF